MDVSLWSCSIRWNIDYLIVLKLGIVFVYNTDKAFAVAPTYIHTTGAPSFNKWLYFINLAIVTVQPGRVLFNIGSSFRSYLAHLAKQLLTKYIFHTIDVHSRGILRLGQPLQTSFEKLVAYLMRYFYYSPKTSQRE